MPFDPNDFGLPNDYEPDFTDPVPFSPRKFMDYLRDFGTALTSGLATKVGVTEKGAVNGVATLGPDGRLPQTQLPITGTTTVDWGAVYNRPAAFPPSAHTHTRAHITDLQPALDAKANVSHAHLIADVAGLQTILDGKAAVADVSAVQTAAMPRAGGVFTGGTQWQATAGHGAVGLVPGTATNPGYIQFHQPSGVRAGYIGWQVGSSRLGVYSENGWTYDFNVAPTVAGAPVATQTWVESLKPSRAVAEAITANWTFNAGVSLPGSQALSFSTHGGGWFMSDTGWLRSLGDKGIYTGGQMLAGSFSTPNGSFYVDTNGLLTIKGASPTITFQDTDHNSAFIHVNSNLMYFMRGTGVNVPYGSWASPYPLYINLTNNNAVFGAGVYAIGDITAYYSDRRLKTDFAPIEDAIGKVKALNGVRYRANGLAGSFGYDTSEAQVGLIAQEVEAVLPEAVTLAPFDRADDGTSKSGEAYLTIKHDRLVPLLVEAFKASTAKLEAAEATIDAQRAAIADLGVKLARVEAVLSTRLG